MAEPAYINKCEMRSSMLKRIEAQLKEAQRLEGEAMAREERAIRREEEGRRWEIAGRAREERLARSLEQQLDRTRAWENRTREAEEREAIWRGRAGEAYRRAERLEAIVQAHSLRLAALEGTLL